MVRLVRGDSSQRASHVGIENLQSVDITGIHPAESVIELVPKVSTKGGKEQEHTLHAELL